MMKLTHVVPSSPRALSRTHLVALVEIHRLRVPAERACQQRRPQLLAAARRATAEAAAGLRRCRVRARARTGPRGRGRCPPRRSRCGRRAQSRRRRRRGRPARRQGTRSGRRRNRRAAAPQRGDLVLRLLKACELDYQRVDRRTSAARAARQCQPFADAAAAAAVHAGAATRREPPTRARSRECGGGEASRPRAGAARALDDSRMRLQCEQSAARDVKVGPRADRRRREFADRALARLRTFVAAIASTCAHAGACGAPSSPGAWSRRRPRRLHHARWRQIGHGVGGRSTGGARASPPRTAGWWRRPTAASGRRRRCARSGRTGRTCSTASR